MILAKENENHNGKTEIISKDKKIHLPKELLNRGKIGRKKAKKLFDEIKDENMDGNKKHRIVNDNGDEISKERLISTLIRNDGRLIRTMKDLKIASYFKLQRYLQTSKEFHELEKFFQSKLCDKAEDVLIECLESDNMAIKFKSAQFILETLGKQNGYDKSQSLINIDLRNNPGQLEDKIKSIFAINNKEYKKVDFQVKDEIIDLDNLPLNDNNNNDDETPKAKKGTYIVEGEPGEEDWMTVS